MNRHGRIAQRLSIGIAHHERHIVNAFFVHMVHGIAAATTNTNHFDDAVLFFLVVAKIENTGEIIVVFHCR